MDSEKMREEFERIAGVSWEDAAQMLKTTWSEAWRLSRENLVIELPDPFWPGYIEEYGDTVMSADLFTRGQVEEAISITGVKFK